MFLGVDSPLFSAIVLFKNQPFAQVFGGSLERSGSLERMEMEVTPTIVSVLQVGLQTRRFPKDPWKEWKWKLPLESCALLFPHKTTALLEALAAAPAAPAP